MVLRITVVSISIQIPMALRLSQQPWVFNEILFTKDVRLVTRKKLGGRSASMNLASSNKTVKRVCVHGGKMKWRALSLDSGVLESTRLLPLSLERSCKYRWSLGLKVLIRFLKLIQIIRTQGIG